MKKNITTAARSEQAAWHKVVALALSGRRAGKAGAQHMAARERLADALGLRGAERFRAAQIYKALEP